jgi:transcription elongation factor Elf1
MTINELITALQRLEAESGSIVCLGCGYEHNCDILGCAIIREAADRLDDFNTVFNEGTIVRLAGRCLKVNPARLRELAEADKDGRLVVLPFTSGRTLLCKENIDSPRLMKDVELAIRYCSSCGIVFHMGYNVFCDLVKHGRITAVSEEAEKALEAMKDE